MLSFIIFHHGCIKVGALWVCSIRRDPGIVGDSSLSWKKLCLTGRFILTYLWSSQRKKRPRYFALAKTTGFAFVFHNSCFTCFHYAKKPCFSWPTLQHFETKCMQNNITIKMGRMIICWWFNTTPYLLASSLSSSDLIMSKKSKCL